MEMSSIWNVSPSVSGNYECGLCGDDGNGNWNNSEWGSTTAVIFKE